MSEWHEVADGVFQRRYDPLDISVCVVRGQDGLLLVDTRRCPREADEIRADLRQLGDLAVSGIRGVVNTHAHFDHTFGNQRFGPASDIDVPIYGHHLVSAHLDRFERPRLQVWIEERDEGIGDWEQVVITPPTELVHTRRTVDLGDRAVELVHFGRGHTDNDLLVHIPDASTWLAGDLVEESGPPMYGSGCYPLEWPDTVAALAARLDERSVVVPGHGRAVGPDYVRGQLTELRRVADLIRELHAAGVPEGDALAEAGTRWPFPADGLGAAISVGYLELNTARG